jgi:hypothetical protein
MSPREDPDNAAEESAYDAGRPLNGDATDGPLLDCELDALAFSARHIGAPGIPLLTAAMTKALALGVPRVTGELRAARARIAELEATLKDIEESEADASLYED